MGEILGLIAREAAVAVAVVVVQEVLESLTEEA